MTHIPHLSPGAHVVDVDGLSLSYHVAGEGPLCVVHPGGPGASWEYLRMPLLEQQLTMIYLEPAGTGASGRLESHPTGYTVARYGELLQNFLETLELDDVFLLGHSHGGFVAQQAALAAQQRLAGIILYATSALTGPAFMQSADANVRAFVAADDKDPRRRAILDAWQDVPAISDDASYTRTMRQLLPVYFANPWRPDLPLAAMQAAIRFSLVVGDNEPFDVRGALSGLALPMLVIAGEQDFICGPDWGRTITAAAPHAEQAFFANCGHLAHAELPDIFAATVNEFVRRHTLGAS